MSLPSRPSTRQMMPISFRCLYRGYHGVCTFIGDDRPGDFMHYTVALRLDYISVGQAAFADRELRLLCDTAQWLPANSARNIKVWDDAGQGWVDIDLALLERKTKHESQEAEQCGG